MASITKEIIFPDVSFYQESIDWSIMSSKSNSIIIRAGQNLWEDPKFKDNYLNAKLHGMLRGIYWLYDDRISPKEQVDLLISLIGADYPEMEIFCDWEGTYNGEFGDLSDVVEFMMLVEQLVPGCIVGMYTGYYWFKNNSDSYKHAQEYSYLATKPLWLAWYTNDPSRVRVPLPWTKVTHWQYTETGNGNSYGASTNGIDLNYFNGTIADFEARYGSYSNNDVHEKWFSDNVEYVSGYRDVPRPFYFHYVKFRKDAVTKVHVNGHGFLGTGEYFWRTRGEPDIVINGDEGYYDEIPVLPKGLGVSDGTVYKNKSSETNVLWDKNHNIIGISNKVEPGTYNAVGGSNDLLINGKLPNKIDDVYVDPRTSIFWNDTYYFLIIIDGRNNGTLGLTRKELAEFALTLGAINGRNNDGGDSCTLIFNYNGTPIVKNNLPEGYMHSVVNHVGFWIDKIPQTPNGGEMNFECIKKVRKRKNPSFYAPGSGDTVLGEFSSSVTVHTSEDIPRGGPEYTVEWVQLPDNNWAPMNHYNNGDTYIVPLSQPPVDDQWPDFFTLKDPDGNEQIYDKRT